ncbi:GMP synthase [Acidianus sulfidivorans JP7]|uniref:GMP synthase n=1 Tax=Acidianus sulfidivorans JP7 TaxID=619593 RepID=A0A2U9IJY4_9CREN|nr:type 1 glutamine amidotransferase [Acidianus sulfidivorans]AWR96276.1 GMP synthase [Acidianus sulfidivorans JP7]
MDKILAIYNHPVETLGSFKKFLKAKEIMAEELKGDEDFDALIIMGGPMGVYERDKYTFLNIEMDLVRKSYNAHKRVLGVCLGSQIIAEALGGKVIKGGFGQELGIQKIKLLNNLKEFMKSDEFTVFQWHGDTFSLPPNAELLGYSNKYFQAFKVDKILALQFHAEVSSEIISKWVEVYGEDKKVAEETKNYDKILESNAEKIIKYWLQL